MAGEKSYELPPYLIVYKHVRKLGWLTTRLDGRNRDKRMREKQFAETIKNEMTREDAQDLAIAAAFGKIRLPDVMIPDLTKEHLGNFWAFTDGTKLAALYVLTCSSLYYGVLANEISIKEGKKYAESIYNLFKDSEMIKEKEYFSSIFSYVIKETSRKRQKNIPRELVNILDYPLLLEQQFGTFFTRLENQQKT